MVNMRINMNIRNHMEPINLIELLMMEEQKALTQKIKDNMGDIAFSKSMKIMQKVNDKTAFAILIYFIYQTIIFFDIMQLIFCNLLS